MGLILASTSAIRRAMLDQSGVEFRATPAGIDERKEKDRTRDPHALALALAGAKAKAVSEQYPEDWVIGSDSVVSVTGRLFDKPESIEQAAEHLRFFSGKPLILTSAVALARGGALDWSEADEAVLQVRDLSDDFIAAYLRYEWPEVGYCVGVFRLEGRGVQLFDRIDGSFFTILGMPLVPLLGALRERSVIAG